MSNELKIEIKDVKKEDQYFVVFNTTLANQIIHKDNQYDNTAYIQADGVEGEFKIEGKVSIANGDSFVQKGGYQNSEGFVQWSAKINPSQSTIYKPVITDKPSSNQSIQKDSIALYEMEVDERGNLRKGQLVPKEEYHVNITTNEATYEQELKLTFNQDKIDRAYLLEYQTALFLENGSGEYASNNISLEGNNQEIVRQSTTESIFVRMSSGGGSATGQQSRVTINKKSDTGELLSDTVFELWDKNGTRKIDEKVTNEEGIVVFDKIPIGTYLLKETKAKEGYEISDELKKGKLIKVNRLTATGVEQIHLENKKIVPKTSLTVTKAWEDRDNQDGKRPVFVEVQLKKNGKNEGTPVTLSAGNQWEYQWKDLDSEENGQAVTYEVEELSVPGYEATMDTSQPGKVTITNHHTPEKTSISGEKTWEDKNNQDGLRPEFIVVNVLKNGQEFLSKKVKPVNGTWHYDFKELDKYENGQLINYTVTENTVPGYTPSVVGYDIKNSHTPNKTSVTVTKAWEDNYNQDGKRPKSVDVQLYKNGVKEGEVVSLASGNNWQHQWTNLDEKVAGKVATYTVKEVSDVPEYNTNINDKNPGNIIITNTHEPEKTAISGVKTWDDNNNQDGVRPESIVVNVLKNGQEFLSKKVKPNALGEWRYEIDGLDKYENGQLINYTITENNIPSYTPTVTGFDIKNTDTPDKTSVTVTKSWNDNQNQDGKRPTQVGVQLYKNGEKEGDEIYLSPGNSWQHQWKDLDEKANGQPIEYTVKEVTTIAGYNTVINDKDPGNVIITNNHVPETTTVSGVKTWNDKDDQDGERPEFVIVNVLRNGQEYVSKKVKPNAKGEWNYSFEGLDKYENGKLIQYTVTENTIPGYTPTISGFNITNTHTPDKTSVTVTKAWDDHNNQDGKRPLDVAVQLYKDGKKEGDIQHLSSGNKWQYQWKDLDENVNGQPAIYTVKEITTSSEYTSIVNDKDLGNVIITNTHTPETINLSGEKTWDDNNNQDGVRPEYVIINVLKNGQEYLSKRVKPNEAGTWLYSINGLDKYDNGKENKYTVTENKVTGYTPTVNEYDVTNTHTPDKTSVTVTKTWNDQNNQDGKRPLNVGVQLYKNGEKEGDVVYLSEGNNWNYQWSNLDENQNGQAIRYTVAETTKVPEYTTVINEQNPGNIIITNSHVPATTTITGEKTWDDNNNQDGVRPEYIIVNVLKNGQEFLSKKVKPDDKDRWIYTFKGLDKYENGEVINYTISENSVVSYTPNVSGYDVTNTHTPNKTSVAVNKVWLDGNNQDGKRPNHVLVQLYKNNKKEGEPVKLSSSNNWQYQWEGLDEKSFGQPITYSVKEITDVPGYSRVINDQDPRNVTITNSHTPEKTKISGEKTWEDHDNQDGVRPDYVIVNILKNGQEFLSKKVKPDASDKWQYTVDGLDKYENGQEIKYTVTENNIPSYTPTVTGYNLKNAHTPDKTSVTVTKTWNDNNNQDGIRPQLIGVQLYQNDEKEGEVVYLSASNNWRHQWDGLEENNQGQPIRYTVKEVSQPNGYTTSINDKDPGNIIITNSHTPEKVSVSGVKNWQDDDNQDGVRPDYVIINILKNGKGYLSKKVTADTDWQYDINGLDKYDKGELINYTVTENDVSGYTPTISGYDIENKHTPGKTNVTVSKHWDDSNNQDGLRPFEVGVQLYKNDRKEGPVVYLSAGNNWQYHWTDLDEFESEKKVRYTVKEVTKVPGYETVINDRNQGNILITNRHVPETLTIKGEKTWRDNNNQEGTRPDFVVINVKKNNQEFLSKKVKADESGKWLYSFEGLDKYENGQLIDYSISENDVEGYTPTVKGLDVTNTLTPNKTSMTVNKVWDDHLNQDGKRPEKVSVQLYKNGEKEGQEILLSEKNSWQYQWTDLEDKMDGIPVVYSVKEITEVKGYDTIVTKTDESHTTITNRYLPEMTKVSGEKTWEDSNNQDGVRPEMIQVNLLKNGQLLESKEVRQDKNGQWLYEFDQLAVYEKGQKINYTLTENTVANYTPTVSGFNIKNTYTPGLISVTASKYWNDENNQAGKRPKEIELQLYANGQKVRDVVTLSDKTNWQTTWKDLPNKESGQVINYQVKEVSQDKNYRETIRQDNQGNVIVTNTYIEKKPVKPINSNKPNGSKGNKADLPQMGEQVSYVSMILGLMIVSVVGYNYNKRKKRVTTK